MTLTNLPDGLRLQVALLGADKPKGAEARSSEGDKANCKQYSSGKLKFPSSQPMLIPHRRRKQRYHTASAFAQALTWTPRYFLIRMEGYRF